jgi:hypothetical protein
MEGRGVAATLRAAEWWLMRKIRARSVTAVSVTAVARIRVILPRQTTSRGTAPAWYAISPLSVMVVLPSAMSGLIRSGHRLTVPPLYIGIGNTINTKNNNLFYIGI